MPDSNNPPSKTYLHIRRGLNPHRDSRPPYQSEMIQWNDGYDKGYVQAEKESNAAWQAGYDNFMLENDKIKADLHKQIDSLKELVELNIDQKLENARDLENARAEIDRLNARLETLQDMISR